MFDIILYTNLLFFTTLSGIFGNMGIIEKTFARFSPHTVKLNEFINLVNPNPQADDIIPSRDAGYSRFSPLELFYMGLGKVANINGTETLLINKNVRQLNADDLKATAGYRMERKAEITLPQKAMFWDGVFEIQNDKFCVLKNHLWSIGKSGTDKSYAVKTELGWTTMALIVVAGSELLMLGSQTGCAEKLETKDLGIPDHESEVVYTPPEFIFEQSFINSFGKERVGVVKNAMINYYRTYGRLPSVTNIHLRVNDQLGTFTKNGRTYTHMETSIPGEITFSKLAIDNFIAAFVNKDDPKHQEKYDNALSSIALHATTHASINVNPFSEQFNPLGNAILFNLQQGIKYALVPADNLAAQANFANDINSVFEEGACEVLGSGLTPYYSIFSFEYAYARNVVGLSVPNNDQTARKLLSRAVMFGDFKAFVSLMLRKKYSLLP